MCINTSTGLKLAQLVPWVEGPTTPDREGEKASCWGKKNQPAGIMDSRGPSADSFKSLI